MLRPSFVSELGYHSSHRHMIHGPPSHSFKLFCVSSHQNQNTRLHGRGITCRQQRLFLGFPLIFSAQNWIFWSAAAAAAGLGCLSRRVCAVNPKNIVRVFRRCRPTKPRPCGWVHGDMWYVSCLGVDMISTWCMYLYCTMMPSSVMMMSCFLIFFYIYCMYLARCFMYLLFSYIISFSGVAWCHDMLTWWRYSFAVLTVHTLKTIGSLLR